MKTITDPNNPAGLVCCPRCTFPYPKGEGALSRELKETEVCPHCGHTEALEDYESILRTGKRKYSY